MSREFNFEFKEQRNFLTNERTNNNDNNNNYLIIKTCRRDVGRCPRRLSLVHHAKMVHLAINQCLGGCRLPSFLFPRYRLRFPDHALELQQLQQQLSQVKKKNKKEKSENITNLLREEIRSVSTTIYYHSKIKLQGRPIEIFRPINISHQIYNTAFFVLRISATSPSRVPKIIS